MTDQGFVHGLTPFLQNLTAGNLQALADQAKINPVITTSEFVSSGDSTRQLIAINRALASTSVFQNRANIEAVNANLGDLTKNTYEFVGQVKTGFSNIAGKASIDDQAPGTETSSEDIPILDKIKQTFEDNGIPFGVGLAVGVGAIFLLARR